MQTFQLKVLHRIVPCRRYLKNIRVLQEDTCAFCADSDTLIHFLYECPDTASFWGKVAAWLRRAGGPDISRLSPRDIILGLPASPGAPSGIINYITIFTKYFIQRQKLFHGGCLSLLEWLAELKTKLSSERYMCAIERKPSRFSKWEKILQYLG